MEISEGGKRMKLADIPYDVLGEIFVYCLPDSPLQVEQPDTLHAPMLLCQICSGWRESALSMPRIWKYLFYTIGNRASFADAVMTAQDSTFLHWWRDRLRAIKPFLRLGSARRFIFLRDMSPKSKIFFLDLINSASYLNLDVCCAMALIDLERYEPVVYGNLDTLVLTNAGQLDRWGATNLGHFGRSRILTEVQHSFPISSNALNIRRLIMDPRWIIKKDVKNPSITWSNITHFYACIICERPVWYSLIRECISMVSGYFSLDFCVNSSPDPGRPVHKTLPKLCELVIGSTTVDLRAMLSNLSLPNVLVLRLDNRSLSVDIINEILSSTPALQTLQLAPAELFLRDGSFIEGDRSLTSLPLRNIVPDLKSIHFGGHLQNDPEIYNPEHTKEATKALLGPWLSLRENGNHITQLIFSSHNGRNYQPLKVLIEAVKQDVPPGIHVIVKSWNANSIWNRETIDKLQFVGIDLDQQLFPEFLE